MQLNFIRNVEHAGILFAEKEGFYKAENLEVEVIAGGTGIDPLQVVAAGGADIGVTAASSIISETERWNCPGSMKLTSAAR